MNDTTTRLPGGADSSADSGDDRELLQRFEALLTRAERRGVRVLSAEEVEALPQLYRRALILQTHARDRRLDRELIDHLGNLNTRAALLLRRPAEDIWRWAWRALAIRFPQALWRERWFALGGFSASLLGALFGWYALFMNPQLSELLIPERITALAVQSSNPIDMLYQLGMQIERLFSGQVDNVQLQLFVIALQTTALIALSGLVFGFPALLFGFGFSAMAGAMIAHEQLTGSVIIGPTHALSCIGLLLLISAFASTSGLIVGSGLWGHLRGQKPTLRSRAPLSLVFLGMAVWTLPLLLAALIQSFPLVPTMVQPTVLISLPLGLTIALFLWGWFASHRWGNSR